MRQDSAAAQAGRVDRMGFIHIDHIQGQHEQSTLITDALAKDQPSGTDARTFRVDGLISDQVSTPTCMKEEIVLLSWLIVLLRTREDGRISYEWTYRVEGGSLNGEVASKLSTDEVLPKLQDKVKATLASIDHHVENVKGSLKTAGSSHISLLLSTGSLLENSEGAKSEVREILPNVSSERSRADNVEYRVGSRFKFP